MVLAIFSAQIREKPYTCGGTVIFEPRKIGQRYNREKRCDTIRGTYLFFLSGGNTRMLHSALKSNLHEILYAFPRFYKLFYT